VGPDGDSEDQTDPTGPDTETPENPAPKPGEDVKDEDGDKAPKDGDHKKAPAPKEEAEKGDSKDELYTDADSLAKTSLSSEENGRSFNGTVGFVTGIFSILGGLVIAFKRKEA
jgi:hypothetical protein